MADPKEVNPTDQPEQGPTINPIAGKNDDPARIMLQMITELSRISGEFTGLNEQLRDIGKNIQSGSEHMMDLGKDVEDVITKTKSHMEEAANKISKQFKTAAKDIANNFSGAFEQIKRDAGVVGTAIGELEGLVRKIPFGIGTLAIATAATHAAVYFRVQELSAYAYQAEQGFRGVTPRTAAITRALTEGGINETALEQFRYNWHMTAGQVVQFINQIGQTTRSVLPATKDDILKFGDSILSMARATGQSEGDVFKFFDQMFLHSDMTRKSIDNVQNSMKLVYIMGQTSAAGIKEFNNYLMAGQEHLQLYGLRQESVAQSSIRLNSLMKSLKDQVPGGAAGIGETWKMIAGFEQGIANEPGMLMTIMSGGRNVFGDTRQMWETYVRSAKQHGEEGIGPLMLRTVDWLTSAQGGNIEGGREGAAWYISQRTGNQWQNAPLIDALIKNWDKIQNIIPGMSLQTIIPFINQGEKGEAGFKKMLEARGWSENEVKDAMISFHNMAESQKKLADYMQDPLAKLKEYSEKLFNLLAQDFQKLLVDIISLLGSIVMGIFSIPIAIVAMIDSLLGTSMITHLAAPGMGRPFQDPKEALAYISIVTSKGFQNVENTVKNFKTIFKRITDSEIAEEVGAYLGIGETLDKLGKNIFPTLNEVKNKSTIMKSGGFLDRFGIGTDTDILEGWRIILGLPSKNPNVPINNFESGIKDSVQRYEARDMTLGPTSRSVPWGGAGTDLSNVSNMDEDISLTPFVSTTRGYDEIIWKLTWPNLMDMKNAHH